MLYVITVSPNRFIPDGINWCKIGVSINPHRRMEQLSQQTPFDLVLRDTFEIENRVERKLHNVFQKNFSSRHMRGEWYAFSEEEVKQVIWLLRAIEYSYMDIGEAMSAAKQHLGIQDINLSRNVVLQFQNHFMNHFADDRDPSTVLSYMLRFAIGNAFLQEDGSPITAEQKKQFIENVLNADFAGIKQRLIVTQKNFGINANMPLHKAVWSALNLEVHEQATNK